MFSSSSVSWFLVEGFTFDLPDCGRTNYGWIWPVILFDCRQDQISQGRDRSSDQDIGPWTKTYRTNQWGVSSSLYAHDWAIMTATGWRVISQAVIPDKWHSIVAIWQRYDPQVRGPLDVRVAESTGASEERQPLRCGQCGGPVTYYDRFCNHCGISLG